MNATLSPLNTPFTLSSRYAESVTSSVLSVSASAYLSSDTMGSYCYYCGCSLMEGEVCVESDDSTFGDRKFECRKIEEAVVGGGEAVIYFKFDISFSVPLLRVNAVQGTGGWVGPYTVHLDGLKDGSVDGNIVYVKTVNSGYVKPPTAYNLTTDPQDFINYFGTSAIDNSLRLQMGNLDDPYEKYRGTCENGNVMPILPMMKFNATGGQLEVDFLYHLMVSTLRMCATILFYFLRS